jgi:putative oxidoreductase
MSPHLVAHPGPIPAQAGIGLRFQHHQAVLDVRPLAEHLAARRFVDFRLAPIEPAQRWGGTAMTDVAADKPSPPLALMERAVGLLDGVPYTLLALPLRAAAATVFWNSAQAKLANWDTTIELFTDDYKVPLLPPEFAANMALGIELTTPVLLVLGLLTRAAALVLLGMTAVIEIFVYPQAWPTHIQWASILLVLLCRGPGKLSLDHVLWRRLRGRLGAKTQTA